MESCVLATVSNFLIGEPLDERDLRIMRILYHGKGYGVCMGLSYGSHQTLAHWPSAGGETLQVPKDRGLEGLVHWPVFVGILRTTGCVALDGLRSPDRPRLYGTVAEIYKSSERGKKGLLAGVGRLRGGFVQLGQRP